MSALRVLIVGGGYAGFYAAWKLEKRLRRGEAEVTLVDPRAYMMYQPFLPEVISGAIEPRHAVVSHRRHLKRTNIVTATVEYIDHASKKATIKPELGEAYELEYDHVIVTAGSVTRTFPIPGIAELAVGVKNIEEAVYIRDRVASNFDRAAALPKGPERSKLLSVVVVGGGFAGVETIGELRSFANSLVGRYPNINFDETRFTLIEAMGRIMPEVSLETSKWVLSALARRGAEVLLDTQVTSAEGGHVELSNGEAIDADLIVWTAGVMANPGVTRNTDLPVDERGRVVALADLRIARDGEALEGAWTAGDISAVPDLSGGGIGGMCVPNAQHAVRQGKLLARNLVAYIRGEKPIDYIHKNIGAVAGIGLGVGVFQSGKISLRGLPAWLAHRAYHGLAMPTWERKWRVIWGWWHNFWLGRDNVSLPELDSPRAVFEQFAARPKAPEAKKPAVKADDEPVDAEADTAKATVKKAAPKASSKKPAAKATVK